MSPADALRDLLAPVLDADFEWQFGRWQDAGGAQRYAVLRPAGGAGAQLVRRPQFSLSLIGRRGGDTAAISEAAEAVIALCRDEAGALVYVEAGEPVFVPSADGRPIFEIALSVIET